MPFKTRNQHNLMPKNTILKTFGNKNHFTKLGIFFSPNSAYICFKNAKIGSRDNKVIHASLSKFNFLERVYVVIFQCTSYAFKGVFKHRVLKNMTGILYTR